MVTHRSFLRLLIPMILLLAGPSLARGDVDLEWRPAVQTVDGDVIVQIGLYAVSDDATDQSIGAMDVILEWDPDVLELQGVVNDGPYPWLVSGFLDDSGLDGLNDTFEDGDALYTAFAQLAPNPPAFATPGGLRVTTLQFRSLRDAAGSPLTVPPTQGTYSRTAVYDGFSPGVDVTGRLGEASVDVSFACKIGAIDLAAGGPVDVLFVNGSAGDANRRVSAPEGESLWFVILQPPQPANGKFVVTANFGVPDVNSVRTLPAQVGPYCFPLLLNDGATSDAIWNNIGKVNKVGASRYFDGTSIPDPGRAPAVFVYLPYGDVANLPAGTTLTVQGVIFDAGAASPKGGSSTNAVILEIL